MSSVDHGALTISLPVVWRLVLGLDWLDVCGDTTLSGLALGVDASTEYPTSSVSGEAEGEDGSSERPDVGERDRDLDAWLNILQRVCGSKPVKREPPSGVSQARQVTRRR